MTALVALLDDNGCIERAHLIAKQYIDKALASIEMLPSHPEKEVLYALTQKLITREF